MTKQKKVQKVHGGYIPLSGVTYRFMKVNKAIKLWLSIGLDMQKLLKIKAGSRILLEYDKKNPYKILISKAKNKERNTYSILQHKGARAVHISPGWKFKKPAAAAFKASRKSKVRIRKKGISVELIGC